MSFFEALFSHPREIYASGELILQSPFWDAAYWQSFWRAVACTGLATSAILVGFVSGWRMWLRSRRAMRTLCIVGLQTAILLGLLVLVAGPALRVRQVEAGRNSLVMLVDRSASMDFDEGGITRRGAALRALEGSVWNSLRERFAVEVHAFATELRRLTSLDELSGNAGEAESEDASRTALRQNLARALERAEQRGAAAVLLVSDGREVGASAHVAWNELRSFDIPVFVVAAGRQRIPEDLQLLGISMPARATRGTRVPVTVTLRHGRGTEELAGTDPSVDTARVVVRQGDRPLASAEVRLDPANPVPQVQLEFEVEDPGWHDLEVSVDPLPGESILENNRSRHVLEVLERRQRILYFEGEPRWEYKFLRRALRDDPGVQLVGLLATTDNKRLRQGIQDPSELAEGFPQSRAELFAYDALILGSVEASSLTREQHAHIEAFVRERGGSLLMLAGPNGLAAGGWGASALQVALPTRLPVSDVAALASKTGVLLPTREGALSPWLELADTPEQNRTRWQELPALDFPQDLGPLKLGARVLVETRLSGENAARPLLVEQGYGRGRSMVFAASGTWRWHMQLELGDPRHARFWRQLLRFLVSATTPTTHAWIAGAPEAAAGESPLPGVGGSGLDPRARFEPRDPSQSWLRAELRTPANQPITAARALARVEREDGEVRTLELLPGERPGEFQTPLSLDAERLYRVQITAQGPAGNALIEPIRLQHRTGPRAKESFDPTQDRVTLERIARITGGRVYDASSPTELSELERDLIASPRSVVRSEVYDLRFVPAWLYLLLLGCCGTWALRRHWELD